jgi:hypothetical protein
MTHKNAGSPGGDNAEASPKDVLSKNTFGNSQIGRRTQAKKRTRAQNRVNSGLFAVYAGQTLLGTFATFRDARAFMRASAAIASNKETFR